MKTGGRVLCITKNFREFVHPSLPCPEEGKVYVVASLSDGCGCGHRITLEEFPKGSLPEGDPWICAVCHKDVPTGSSSGWRKAFFIDLEGDAEIDKTQETNIQRGVELLSTAAILDAELRRNRERV